MDVLGIDQSLTCTGLARTWRSGDITVRRVTTLPADGLAMTRSRIRYIVGSTLRFAPDECLTVIEQPVIPAHNAGAVLERAWLFGLLVDQLMERGPVVQVHPSHRAMYATGNGGADKADVLAAMRAVHPSVPVVDDNVADALSLLGIGARYLGEPIDGDLPATHTRALAAINWKDAA